MPQVFDNIDLKLVDALRQTLELSHACDFCVGYFNLRGWGKVDDLVQSYEGGDGKCARILVGMHQTPDEELREALRVMRRDDPLDAPTIKRLQRALTESFRKQLAAGVPTNADEAALRRLARQIREGRTCVKLFVRYPLHAKLYLLHRDDPNIPIVGYVGSSNLTGAGLSGQGELNVDVLDRDACEKLHTWFEERWNDKRGCVDVSDELAAIIETGWTREEPISPYLIYLKMAYHLAQDARTGETEFRLPAIFRDKVLKFQAAAVSLAAHHLNHRGGVLIGDVVGLGKTLMATATAKIWQEDQGGDTLIICPKNLTSMWQQYVDEYQLVAKVMSLSVVQTRLPDLRRYRLVVIDESHNLRNREGRRYQAIREYIQENECRCILLTATPYNKQFEDLSNQLRLLADERQDLGIRPEAYFRERSESEFISDFQASPRSLIAFEKSLVPDDWRDLMRLFMVRRTRQFIKSNYAEIDPADGRYYLTFPSGLRFYFPERVPRNLAFALDDDDPNDQYARLYRDEVVNTISNLALPRYGLFNHLVAGAEGQASDAEKRIIENLSKAGARLIGYCRTNLFKRLESSGHSFLLSLDRHILRNMVYVHALDNDLPIPIGTQEVQLLDSSRTDADLDRLEQDTVALDFLGDDDSEEEDENADDGAEVDRTVDAYHTRAAVVYKRYAEQLEHRFKWLPADFFKASLRQTLEADARDLIEIQRQAGDWDPSRDAKLAALEDLLRKRHAQDKVIVFTQFADTAAYLADQLKERDIEHLEPVTARNDDPTALARRFSPESNDYRIKPSETELRVLIATDVLSEGQNLQDAFVVVNFDLPWAIIRLIQRAGRVDRIGQHHREILVYSFLPATGVERVIGLQTRLQARLMANQEVVGTDEAFFGEEGEEQWRDVYTEKAGSLDGEEDTEVDLQSQALQIWKKAIEENPSLEKAVAGLPPVVYATRDHEGTDEHPEGTLVYMRTADGVDALVRVARDGEIVTQSLSAILRAAQCGPDTEGHHRHETHHGLVRRAVEHLVAEQSVEGGHLGHRRSSRRRAYERLAAYHAKLKEENSIFATEELEKVVQDIYKHRLAPTAQDRIGRQLRAGIDDEGLADLAVRLREEGRLSDIEEGPEIGEPEILCSMGLFPAEECQGDAGGD